MTAPRGWRGRTLAAGAAVAAAGALGALAASAIALDAAVTRAERRHNPVHSGPGTPASDRARALHETLRVVDLHADTLLWGRDLLRRAEHGHADVPRWIEGRVALQVLAAAVKSPRHLNIERNEDRGDDVLWIALGRRWPLATWRSPLARALHFAQRAHAAGARSDGAFRVIETRADLETYLAARDANAAMTASLLAIEGAHALEGDPANVEVVAAAGYRMLSPAHFFDTAFGGSAHGVERHGLTKAGRDMLHRMEARGVLLDVAHASAATIDDALALSTRPVVASHTGLRGVVDNARNLSDAHVRGIAATGGLVGIGFWPTACGGEDADAIARSIAYAADLVGIEHVALGSDWDGGVPVPFDAAHVVRLTQALLDAGFDEPSIRAVMGGNVLRVLAAALPAA